MQIYKLDKLRSVWWRCGRRARNPCGMMHYQSQLHLGAVIHTWKNILERREQLLLEFGKSYLPGPVFYSLGALTSAVSTWGGTWGKNYWGLTLHPLSSCKGLPLPEPNKKPQVALLVKNLFANVGDVRDMGSIPGMGRCPGGGHSNPL